jgi:hypothetical protein
MTARAISKRLGLATAVATALTTLVPAPAPAQDASSTMSENTMLGATFALTATVNPNTEGVAYCGGTALALIAEGHGAGYSARFGPVSFFLQKTVDLPPTGDVRSAMHGCLTMTSPDGDTLNFTYDGTYGSPNANNFADANGTLTVTSGKGKFYGLKGISVPFTVSFYFGSQPVPVSAYYSLQ